MGGRISKKSVSNEGSSGNGSSSRSQSNSNSPLIPDLSIYEADCRHDPNLQSFDSIIRDRTTSVIESLAGGRSFSLDSLREVTGGLADINEQVVKLIIQSKEDICNNTELRDLVEEYFQNSSQTLKFYSALDKCLKGIRNSHIFIQLALKRFEEEQNEKIDGGESNCFAKTLQELEKFQAAGDPFTEEFFSVFHSVYNQQVSMLVKLQMKKRKLDTKWKSWKSYRKVSTVLFAAVFATVVICSVVAAAIAAPPVVAALVAASSAPLGAVGKWINSLWKSYENEVKVEMELVFSMEIDTFTAVKELQTIRLLVDKLKNGIESLLFVADFAVKQDDEVAVTLAIDEIKKNMGVFMQTVDVLGVHSDKFSRDISRARAVLLQRIIKYPSS